MLKYNALSPGMEVRAGDCKNLIGDELTFMQLVRESSCSRLLVWMGAVVGEEPTDDTEFLVAQIERVTDFDPESDDDGDEEFATVFLDIPGFSSKPVAYEYEDMDPPEIQVGDGPHALHNTYTRIWRVRSFPNLEQLAIGAAAYGKCKSNHIDTVEELLDAFRTGAIKKIMKPDMIRSVRQVLTVAGITVPEEQLPQKAEIVQAAPAELSGGQSEQPQDIWTRAKALHQRILADAQAVAESLWDMCSAIKEMRDGKHYRVLLYDNFEGYCEDALGMSRAQAYRYIQIAEGMTAENVASMRQIGATKLALLASVTEEQREVITETVDVESTTVRELKAEIARLKSREEENEALLEKQGSTLARYQKDAENLTDSIAKSKGEIDRLNRIIQNNDSYILKLQGKNESMAANVGQLEDRIMELESRPVEVAVQTDEAALEQLRKEYEAKLKEAEEDLKDAVENGMYREVYAMARLVRESVNTLCMRIKCLPAKERESAIKYAKEIGLLLGQLK